MLPAASVSSRVAAWPGHSGATVGTVWMHNDVGGMFLSLFTYLSTGCAGMDNGQGYLFERDGGRGRCAESSGTSSAQWHAFRHHRAHEEHHRHRKSCRTCGQRGSIGQEFTNKARIVGSHNVHCRAHSPAMSVASRRTPQKCSTLTGTTLCRLIAASPRFSRSRMISRMAFGKERLWLGGFPVDS